MMFKKKKIIVSIIISFIGVIVLFNISLRLLNLYFPTVILIDDQEKHIMPIRNILWSIFASFVLLTILLFGILKNKNPKTKALNLIQKQVLATECFSKYCIEKEIYHLYIDELINHLLSIENTKNLPFWENKGAKLKLNGRGDELPNEIEMILKSKDRKTFIEILESTVEVGIVDMYGAETKESELYLKKCFLILNKNKISIPKTESDLLRRH